METFEIEFYRLKQEHDTLTKPKSMSIPTSLIETIQDIADEDGRTLSKTVVDLLLEALTYRKLEDVEDV